MGDVIEVSWTDILEEEGILKRGYGCIPKYAMLDPSLSITAKSIYAYFCACAGSGTTTFPGRDTIVFHLNINKDTYHKYSKELKDNGYISVRKAAPRPGQGNKFTHNVYTIEAYPKRFSEDPRFQDQGDRRTIALEGIKAAGYGLIPRMVMEDPRISAKAKALYAYLASYTGGGKSAFPELKKTLYFLHISNSTYKILIKELVKVNFVEVIQRHVGGRLSVNDYYLISNPNLAKVSTDTFYNKRKAVITSQKPEVKVVPQKESDPGATAQAQEILQNIPLPNVSVQAQEILQNFSRAEVSVLVQELQRKLSQPDASSQGVEFSDTGDYSNLEHEAPEIVGKEGFIQEAEISDTGIQDMVKQDEGIQDTEEQDKGKQDTQKPDTIKNSSSINSFSIINSINQHQAQTPLCDWFDSMDKTDIEREIKEEMGFYAVEQGRGKYAEDMYASLITLVVDTISRKQPSIWIGKELHTREEVIERLYQLTYWEYDYVIESVNSIGHEIRNLQAYYLASLYNAKKNLMLRDAKDIAKDIY